MIDVIDGDTLDARIDGVTERVRLIGIDTPEVGECYYDEATNRLTQLVAGEYVELVKDVSETGPYGRLLRYVFLGNQHINLQMVSEGYAVAAEYPPDTAYADVFAQAEDNAQTAHLGRWGHCDDDQPLVDGVCGFNDGVMLSSAPVTGLCYAGTPSAVSGTGPWTWTCEGSTDASCSADVYTLPPEPGPEPNTILCNDGTRSPTCYTCRRGCCSHHGGCR